MYLNYLFISLFLFLDLLVLIILFFISAFLVRFRTELSEALNSLSFAQKVEEPKTVKGKTWDQKYEDDLEVISQRIRQNADGEL